MTEDEMQMAKTAAETALKPVADLVKCLFGESVQQIGGMLGDGVKARRMVRQIKLMNRVKHKLLEAGIQPSRIDDSIWIPLLQNASLQDDETLQERWANLLANAADSNNKKQVMTSFNAILAELTPRAAIFLDTLFDAATRPVAPLPFALHTPGYTKGQLTAIYDAAGLRDDGEDSGGNLFELTISLLERSGILSMKIAPMPIKIQGGKKGFGMLTATQSMIDIETRTAYAVSELGWAFIEACRAPRRSSPSDDLTRSEDFKEERS